MIQFMVIVLPQKLIGVKMSLEDFVNERYGRLVAVEFVGRSKWGHQVWLFQCDCGKTKTIDRTHVTRGTTKSCGCLRSQLTSERFIVFGIRQNAEVRYSYGYWIRLRRKIHDKNYGTYPKFGGMGITMDPEWNEDFVQYYNDVGPRPKKHELERIDLSKGFELGNVEWRPKKYQEQYVQRLKKRGLRPEAKCSN